MYTQSPYFVFSLLVMCLTNEKSLSHPSSWKLHSAVSMNMFSGPMCVVLYKVHAADPAVTSGSNLRSSVPVPALSLDPAMWLTGVNDLRASPEPQGILTHLPSCINGGGGVKLHFKSSSIFVHNILEITYRICCCRKEVLDLLDLAHTYAKTELCLETDKGEVYWMNFAVFST